MDYFRFAEKRGVEEAGRAAKKRKQRRSGPTEAALAKRTRQKQDEAAKETQERIKAAEAVAIAIKETKERIKASEDRANLVELRIRVAELRISLEEEAAIAGAVMKRSSWSLS